jgi:acyl-CoA dehydrogenase
MIINILYRMALNYVGAYARVRKQFKVPIAEMGGVQEALARIASQTYCMASAQSLINAMLSNHEQPAVLSAVMKSETTHRTRLVINDAMDVVGGAGICRGPNNIVGNGYMSLPIAITVEGANILTRCLIIYGQGLNRAHPNLINIINSLQKGDDPHTFAKEMASFFKHLFVNSGRSIIGSLLSNTEYIPGLKTDYIHGSAIDQMLKSIASTGTTGTGAAISDTDTQVFIEYYERILSRRAANFAACADLSLTLGSRLKVPYIYHTTLALYLYFTYKIENII